MHKVIKIIEYAATRDIELLNEETGTVDLCFDDSMLVSRQNFEFMREGKIYDCKIALFGHAVKQKTESCIECKIIKDITVGKMNMTEVMVGQDIYYLSKNELNGFYNGNTILYEWTRKDLVQVNDVIHDMMLGEL